MSELQQGTGAIVPDETVRSVPSPLIYALTNLIIGSSTMETLLLYVHNPNFEAQWI
jgi:hypothetical protein